MPLVFGLKLVPRTAHSYDHVTIVFQTVPKHLHMSIDGSVIAEIIVIPNFIKQNIT